MIPQHPAEIDRIRQTDRHHVRVFFGDELTWIASTKTALLAAIAHAEPDTETEFVLSPLGDIEPSA